MGLFSNSNSQPQVQLQPFNPPLGVFPNYAVNVPTTLVLKESAFSFSGDDFSIRDAAGVEVVRCHGKAIGFGDKKKFKDVQGNELFTLRNKLIAIHKTFVAERPDGTDLFKVKASFALIGSKMTASFTNASDGHEIELSLKGSIMGRSAEIVLGDRPVATISRQLFNAREAFTDNQTYYVTVAPGVDLALIAAICICFDEKEHEKN